LSGGSVTAEGNPAIQNREQQQQQQQQQQASACGSGKGGSCFQQTEVPVNRFSTHRHQFPTPDRTGHPR
jgi:hypothetical protein